MFEQTTPAKTQPDPVPIANRSPRPSDFRKGNDGRPASFGGSWRLDEDDKEAMIPAPNRPNSQNRRSYGQTSSDKQDKPARYSSPFKQEKTSPVVLPQKASFNVPPFKHIQNREQKSRVSVSKVTEQAVESREVSWPTALKAPEKRDGPVTDEAENTEPEQNEQSHAHSSRYMRFVHSKGTPGPMKTFQTGLKGSLEAAKVVMEEEKSSAGSSNASTRSSLSNKELNNIAHRALDLLNGKGNQSASKEKSVPVILPTLRSLNSLPASVATKGTKGSDEQQPANRVSRAGKLSQNLHRSQSPAAERAETPDQSQEGAEKASEQNTTPRKSRAAAVSGGGRRTKTVTNTSHQEARRALLNAAQRKKEKAGLTKKQSETEEEVEPEKEDANQGIPEETNDVAVRLGLKASRALAMKNSTKIGNPPKDQINTAFELSTVGSAISSTLSLDSTKSRRLNHPAFVARSASPKVGTSMSRAFSDSDFQNNKETEPAKPFSEELFSSFRHFNASRTPKEANPTAKGKSFWICFSVIYVSVMCWDLL